MLHRERDKVKRILAIGKSLPLDDAETIGHWSRYACIASTGYIETAFRLIIQEHVKLKATREISAYVVRDLEGVQNPKCEKIIKVLRSFSEEWGNKLNEYFIKNPDVKDAIDSLMNNRHLIAHGRACTITLGRVSDFFDKADNAIEFINTTINPQNTL